MANCRQCICEQVCRFNDGHNLYCKEDYKCPHYKSIDDTLEVVRCKDCLYNFKSDIDGYFVCSAMTNPNYVPLNHFCGYGERKAD